MKIKYGLLVTFSLFSLLLSPLNGASNTSLIYSVAGNQTNDVKNELEAIFVATNQQRARKRLPPLKKDSKLMAAAQQYADLMAAREQMSHNIGGLNLADKAKRVGYSFRLLSENIALNTELDGRFVVQEQWMKSKGHRKNIMDDNITDIGIGISGPSKKNRYYYCQLFGTPR